MNTPDHMNTTTRHSGSRDPHRTVPPLCGDPGHGHGGMCAEHATPEGLLATLREADEILTVEIVAVPTRVYEQVMELLEPGDRLIRVAADQGGSRVTFRRPSPDDGLTSEAADAVARFSGMTEAEMMGRELRDPLEIPDELTSHADEAQDRIGSNVPGREVDDTTEHEPRDGLATTRALFDELQARIEVDGATGAIPNAHASGVVAALRVVRAALKSYGRLDYRTVDELDQPDR